MWSHIVCRSEVIIAGARGASDFWLIVFKGTFLEALFKFNRHTGRGRPVKSLFSCLEFSKLFSRTLSPLERVNYPLSLIYFNIDLFYFVFVCVFLTWSGPYTSLLLSSKCYIDRMYKTLEHLTHRVTFLLIYLTCMSSVTCELFIKCKTFGDFETKQQHQVITFQIAASLPVNYSDLSTQTWWPCPSFHCKCSVDLAFTSMTFSFGNNSSRCLLYNLHYFS